MRLRLLAGLGWILDRWKLAGLMDLAGLTEIDEFEVVSWIGSMEAAD